MNLPGRELDGIHFAMEYLPDATCRIYGAAGARHRREGKHVMMIGGGDTGSDCLGTAIRQGAKSVTVLQIMPKEPTSRPDNQPWPTFARLYQKTSSMEEGGEYIYNTDSVSFERQTAPSRKAHNPAKSNKTARRPKGSWPMRKAM